MLKLISTGLACLATANCLAMMSFSQAALASLRDSDKCPTTATFKAAVDRTQQVHQNMFKQALLDSGLPTAAGLDHTEQARLIIQYRQTDESGPSAVQKPVFTITTRKLDEHKTLYEITYKLTEPVIHVAGPVLVDVLQAKTPQDMSHIVYSHATTWVHEIAHLIVHDSLTGIARRQVELHRGLSLDCSQFYMLRPRPLHVHPSAIHAVVAYEHGNSELATHPERHLILRSIDSTYDQEFLKRSPEHASRWAELACAAQHYESLYENTQRIESFWEKSGISPQLAKYTQPCLQKLIHTYWPILQQATWFSHHTELSADKHAVNTIVNLPIDNRTKQTMIANAIDDYEQEIRRKGKDISPDEICTHPPYARRIELLQVGLAMIQKGRTAELTRQLDNLAIPNYLRIPRTIRGSSEWQHLYTKKS